MPHFHDKIVVRIMVVAATLSPTLAPQIHDTKYVSRGIRMHMDFQVRFWLFYALTCHHANQKALGNKSLLVSIHSCIAHVQVPLQIDMVRHKISRSWFMAASPAP
jgi:hypothetical protein